MPLCQKNAMGVVLVALFIDDNLMVNEVLAIDDVISALRSKGRVLKVMEKMKAK